MTTCVLLLQRDGAVGVSRAELLGGGGRGAGSGAAAPAEEGACRPACGGAPNAFCIHVFCIDEKHETRWVWVNSYCCPDRNNSFQSYLFRTSLNVAAPAEVRLDFFWPLFLNFSFASTNTLLKFSTCSFPPSVGLRGQEVKSSVFYDSVPYSRGKTQGSHLKALLLLSLNSASCPEGAAADPAQHGPRNSPAQAQERLHLSPRGTCVTPLHLLMFPSLKSGAVMWLVSALKVKCKGTKLLLYLQILDTF